MKTTERSKVVLFLIWSMIVFVGGNVTGGILTRITIEADHNSQIIAARTKEVRECTRLIQEFVTGHDPLFRPKTGGN